MGAAVGDYDNDGDPDLFVPGVGQPSLYRNRATAASRTSPWPPASGRRPGRSPRPGLDVDRDGRLDLFVVNYLDWNAAGRALLRRPRARPARVLPPEVLHGPAATSSIRNRGDGTFEDVSKASGIAAHVGKGMSVGVGDFDADGRDDVFVTNDGVPNFLFRNVDGRRFEEIGVARRRGAARLSAARCRAWAWRSQDVTGDGRPDLLVTASKGETFPLFVNDGAMTFHDGTHQARLAGAEQPAQRLGRGPRRPRQRRTSGHRHRQLARERPGRPVRGVELQGSERHPHEPRGELRGRHGAGWCGIFRRASRRTAAWSSPTSTTTAAWTS